MALDDTAFTYFGILLDEGKGVYYDTLSNLSLWVYGGQWANLCMRHCK